MAEPVLLTPPAVEPVTLAEAKAWLQVEHTDDDAKITGLIVSAREQCEHIMGRKIIDQVWEIPFDGFPVADSLAMRLHWGVIKVSAIMAIIYQLADGGEFTWPAENYGLDPHTLPGYVVLKAEKSWPSDALDGVNSVRVQVKSGFGPTADLVPEAIKSWIKRQIGSMYENREAMTVGSVPHADENANRAIDRWTILTI